MLSRTLSVNFEGWELNGRPLADCAKKSFTRAEQFLQGAPDQHRPHALPFGLIPSNYAERNHRFRDTAKADNVGTRYIVAL